MSRDSADSSEHPTSDRVMQHVHEQNRRVYDAMARRQTGFAQPVREDQLRDPLKHVDGDGWLGGNIRGWRVLCLAAGGGRQSLLYAAAGADVTVVDISPEMLALDREGAARLGLNVRTIETSMERLPMFGDASFDLCIHPVSTCYVPQIQPVFDEIARVVAPGGLYISQHKTPSSLQAKIDVGQTGHYRLVEPYYRSGALPAVRGSRLREDGAAEFVHRWEEIVGGICRAGFFVEDLVEPFHADFQAVPDSFAHRACYVAPYVRIKARRRSAGSAVSIIACNSF